MKKIFVIIAALFVSTSAFAAQPCPDGSSQPCNTTPVTPPVTPGTTNAGGAGGNAIAGAVAGAVSVSGAVSGSSASNRTDVSNTNTNSNTATGGQGGAGGAGGQALSSSYASGGSALSVNGGNTMVVESDKRSRVEIQTTGIAPDMISSPTAPCRVALGASAGWLGGAFGFNGSVLDEGCDAREDARMLNNLGLKTEAVTRLCAKPEMAKALGEARCPTPKQEPAQVHTGG